MYVDFYDLWDELVGLEADIDLLRQRFGPWK